MLRSTGEGKEKRLAAGFAAGIASRKESAGHGHGLKNIARAIEKYNGYMNITHDAQTFTAIVLLYINE